MKRPARLLKVSALCGLVVLGALVPINARSAHGGTAARFRALHAKPASASNGPGAVFIRGRYVRPPYRLRVAEGRIFLNGRVLRSLPASPPPAADAAPAAPKTAADLVAIAAARLQALASEHKASVNHVPKAIRAQLIALIRSYKLATRVSDNGFALVVHTHGGIGAELIYKDRLAPTAAQLQSSLAAEAGSWRDLLQSGGMLIVSSATVEQIPSARAQELLQGINAATRTPMPRRLRLLTGLLADRGLAHDFLVASHLPPELLQRFHVSVGAIRAPGAVLRPSILPRHALNQSTAASHTPIYDTAYFFSAVTGDSGEMAPVVSNVKLDNYDVVQYAYSGICSPGSSTISNFVGTSGKAGVLYVSSHGNNSALALEAHCTKSDANAAAKAYIAGGQIARGDIDLEYSEWTSIGGKWWYVGITGSGIQHLWKDANTIVELSACDTLNLDNKFNAREFIAPADLVTRPESENKSFWDRVAGIQDNGTKRNVGDVYAASEFPTATGKWGLISKASGRTVLAPAVVSVSPDPATSVVVGQPVIERVTFDTPIAASSTAVQHDFGIPTISDVSTDSPCRGKWNAQPDHWIDDHTVEFKWTPQAPGVQTISVVARRTWSGDAATGLSHPELDGNQSPAGSNHVGPNGDDYVYQRTCMLPPTATPGQVPPNTPTPLPTATAGPSCKGPVTLLIDGFNPGGVMNGAIPPMVTVGNPNANPPVRYCLISMATYHWNNGNGVIPGQIGLKDANGAFVGGGPWQAVGTSGQGGAPDVNWVVTLPANPPVILSGTYTVFDSSPATWAQNAASGGAGFVRIWVQVYQ
jgi:hypothetical protein